LDCRLEIAGCHFLCLLLLNSSRARIA
jgi:hypothetical protein